MSNLYIAWTAFRDVVAILNIVTLFLTNIISICRCNNVNKRHQNPTLGFMTHTSITEEKQTTNDVMNDLLQRRDFGLCTSQSSQ